MADDPRAGENTAEDRTQQEQMPSSEQKPVSQGGTASAAAAKQEPETAKSPGDKLALPDGVRERTREQFEKLKAQNREMKQMLEQFLAGAKQPQPTTQGGEVEQFIDPATGEVDVASLNKAFAEAKQKADLALKTIQQKEAERQEQEAYATYPELNPNSEKVNKEFFRKTRAVLMDSIINPQDYGGKPLTLKQAADFVKKPEQAAAAQGEQAGVQKALSQLTPKEQASLEATGRSDRRGETLPSGDLAEKSREGDLAAVVERLKRSKL